MKTLLFQITQFLINIQHHKIRPREYCFNRGTNNTQVK